MKKKYALAVLALVAVMAVLFFLWRFTRPETAAGEKSVTVVVVHQDQSENTFEFTTDAEYLGEALVEEGIVEDNQSAYGLYILTADGETANEGNQEWWCVTKDGGRVDTGASETPLLDGDHYELTFTVGYGG